MTATNWSNSYARVVFFGDSITEQGFSMSEKGWCAAVAEHFTRKADITNRGLGGYNTRQAKVILQDIVTSENIPNFIVIFFGANDAATNQAQHVPLDEYEKNLAYMCEYLFEKGMTNDSILLVTPPPACDEDVTKATGISGDRLFASAQKYAAGVIEVGQRLGVGVANVFSKIGERDDYRDYLSDGLHLNEKGNRVVADEVIKFLDNKIGDQKVFPQWDEKGYWELQD